MDSTKERLFKALMNFKKIHALLCTASDLSIGEMFALKKIEHLSGQDGSEVHVSNLQEQSHMSMPAVSQILNTLEKKHCISREISSKDRRKIIVTLTPEGKKELESSNDRLNSLLDEVILRFGEQETEQLIELIHRFIHTIITITEGNDFA